jgi:hypothetical protein
VTITYDTLAGYDPQFLLLRRGVKETPSSFNKTAKNFTNNSII